MTTKPRLGGPFYVCLALSILFNSFEYFGGTAGDESAFPPRCELNCVYEIKLPNTDIHSGILEREENLEQLDGSAAGHDNPDRQSMCYNINNFCP